MTTAELAKHAMLSRRTIRRYTADGHLKPRRHRIGERLRFEFTLSDLDRALWTSALMQRRLASVSPGLERYQRHRREHL